MNLIINLRGLKTEFITFPQTHETLSFLVSIKDKVSDSGDSENDNFVQVPITVIVLDENDNQPEFQHVSVIKIKLNSSRWVESSRLKYVCLT